MASRNTSGTNTVLIIFMLLITFPIWVTLGGIMLGLAGGLIGVLVGVCAAIFGVFLALIVLPFKILFGRGDWDITIHSFTLEITRCSSLR